MDEGGGQARSEEIETGQEDGLKWKEVERHRSSQSQAWGGKGGSLESKVTARLSTWVRSLRNRTELGGRVVPSLGNPILQ